MGEDIMCFENNDVVSGRKTWRLTYVTNNWCHYQASVCRELVRLLGEDRFQLCLFGHFYDENLVLGQDEVAPDCKWIVGPPKSSDDVQRIKQVLCDADVAVLGACPHDAKVARVATGKLTFVMSERISKSPFHWWQMLDPRRLFHVVRYRNLANRENVHYLPMGAFAAKDARRIRAYGDRMWTWAYLPDLAVHPPLVRTNTEMRILWVGRMLDWKCVDLLLKAVTLVCGEQSIVRLDIVGAGPMRAEWRALAQELGLGGKCNFHEPVPPERVREMMRQADVYVMPSNRHEGWGVVVNEAMSEGAVLVANEQAGAAQVLIEHGRTGFLFEDDNVGSLADVLQTLLGDVSLREKIRQAAWQELHKKWHPRIGAERLVALSQGLLELAPMPDYAEGLCCRETTD